MDEAERRIERAAFADQHVQIRVRDLFDKTAEIMVQMLAVLCDSNAGDPLVQLALRVNTHVPDVFGIFGLDLGMLDAETKVGRGLEFALPADAVVHLVHVKGAQAHQVLGVLLPGRSLNGGYSTFSK